MSQRAMSCPHCDARLDRGDRAGCAPVAACRQCGRTLSVCGGFSLGDEVGRGGVAVVREAHHQSGRDAVVKVLERTALNSWQVHQLFARSARLASSFTHEGLPRVLGFERSSERSFLAMERLRGGTLGDRVMAGARVRGPEFEELLRGLLEAVAYLHERSFVHGDITPRNVMFRTASDSQPVLIDLDGLCFPHERGLPSLVMTPGYTPPEQRAGAIGVESDLYGIGATMIYAATGQAPDGFLRAGDALDLDAPLAAAGREARVVVQRLLDLDPRRRPPSARAALRMLRRNDRRLRRMGATLLAAAVLIAVFISLAVASHASPLR